MVCRLARSVRLRTLFASFEQRPKPDHRRSLRTFHAEKLEVHMSDDEKAAADSWIDQYFRFLLPDDDSESSLDWLLETMAAAVARFDPFVCVIDPWNEIEHVRPVGMTQTEYTGWAIRALKRFARKHRVHIIVIAHPAKLQRDRNGEYPKPTLYDIADSAHWANKADLGVMIWRKTGEQEAEIAVVKSRYYSEIGRPGSVKGSRSMTRQDCCTAPFKGRLEHSAPLAKEESYSDKLNLVSPYGDELRVGPVANQTANGILTGIEVDPEPGIGRERAERLFISHYRYRSRRAEPAVAIGIERTTPGRRRETLALDVGLSCGHRYRGAACRQEKRHCHEEETTH